MTIGRNPSGVFPNYLNGDIFDILIYNKTMTLA